MLLLFVSSIAKYNSDLTMFYRALFKELVNSVSNHEGIRVRVEGLDEALDILLPNSPELRLQTRENILAFLEGAAVKLGVTITR